MRRSPLRRYAVEKPKSPPNPQVRALATEKCTEEKVQHFAAATLSRGAASMRSTRRCRVQRHAGLPFAREAAATRVLHATLHTCRRLYARPLGRFFFSYKRARCVSGEERTRK